jgi:hypothetical protein
VRIRVLADRLVGDPPNPGLDLLLVRRHRTCVLVVVRHEPRDVPRRSAQARYESVGRLLRRQECQDMCKLRLHDQGKGRHMSRVGCVFVALLHARSHRGGSLLETGYTSARDDLIPAGYRLDALSMISPRRRPLLSHCGV